MIKSMTGFGHGELVSEDFRITVEMKAVNHRYCDINIKMPKKLYRGLMKPHRRQSIDPAGSVKTGDIYGNREYRGGFHDGRQQQDAL